MRILDAVRSTWIGTFVLEVLATVKRLEVLDRSYTLAAQTFVAMFPLILVLAASAANTQGEPAVTQEMIDRFQRNRAASPTHASGPKAPAGSSSGKPSLLVLSFGFADSFAVGAKLPKTRSVVASSDEAVPLITTFCSALPL